MSYNKILRETWKKPDDIPGHKERVREWRRDNVVVRVEKPTNPAKAHALGYRAKQGFIVVRSRIEKGGRRRQAPAKGRNPGKFGLVHFTPPKKRQTILEQRVAKKFVNMEVLNSYQVGRDGQYHYYEVILVDPALKTSKSAHLGKGKGRVFRGLTSSSKKSRSVLHVDHTSF